MIIYHLLHFLKPIQHTGVVKELGWKHRATPETAPFPQAAWPSQLRSLAQPGNELDYVVEGREKPKPYLGCGAWMHLIHPAFPCSGNMGGWMMFGHRTGMWGRWSGTSTSPTFFSSSSTSFWPPDFLPFHCHYCLLSLLHRQQWQQELQKFWRICLLLIPLTWLQGAYLSCSALAMTLPFVRHGESSRTSLHRRWMPRRHLAQGAINMSGSPCWQEQCKLSHW